ncbi:MAG: copper homeostasis protein CutC [Pirellulaceae bacterium]
MPNTASLKFELEVCVDQVSDALAAAQAGATRIEMNCALELDGLTPSIASCQWLKQQLSVPIVAMLRAHARSFLYTPAEESEMLRDCRLLLAAGVDGIVFGCLNEHGQIALPILKKIRALCGERELIFHRAFDALDDQVTGLEQLIECGVVRVLTSGGAATAELGCDQLRRLEDQADGRIEILPGGGIHSGNARFILERTGCRQLHGSFRLSGSTVGPSLDDICQTRKLLHEQFA